MHDPMIAADGSTEEIIAPTPPQFIVRALAWLVGPVRAGALTIDMPSGVRFTLQGKVAGERAHVRLHRWRAVRRFVAGGDTGFAEAYRDGDWSSEDLAALLRWGVDNFETPGGVSDGLLPARLLGWMRHALRANSRRNSRRNIQAHYDLGNAFYAQWLDAGMTYSSGLYASADMSLEAAQAAKLARVMELLSPQAGDRILEIGCGWGALAEVLIAEHGCAVTGLTLSQEQHDYTVQRLAARGLSKSADIRLQDYRDVTGPFDRIVSIEMLEAVGERYWPAYFAKLADSLRPGGVAVLQVITIKPERYEAYRARPDFIQRFVFPGGMLPTLEIVAQQAQRAGLAVTHEESFGASYATTLEHWRDRFSRHERALDQLGFDETFRRLWTFYLAYCEAGFKRGWLNVSLVVLSSGAAQPEPGGGATT